jgi:hypothetical protein
MEELLTAIRKRERRYASEILPDLYLGSGNEASDFEYLKSLGITHILNVADDVENFFPSEFTYCNLWVSDFGQDIGISRVFDSAADFVAKVRQGRFPSLGGQPSSPEVDDDASLTRTELEANEPTAIVHNDKSSKPIILIHCAAGQNRSVTVTVAVLMMLNSMSLKEAFSHVRDKRPGVYPFKDNRAELMRFEKRQTGTVTIDLTHPTFKPNAKVDRIALELE